MAKPSKTLQDLFHETLKDIYFAEKKILASLPKMAKSAQTMELREAFEKHEQETEGQVERLDPGLLAHRAAGARARGARPSAALPMRRRTS
jgi:ferritin-like metal-binding protein YciE